MKQIKIFLLFCFFIILSSFVLADPIEFLFSSIDSINIIDNYEKYYIGIDFVIYLLIFASILKIYAKEQFGNGAVLGLTIVFSISMIFFQIENDFKLADFGFVVAIITVILISLIVYNKISKHSKLDNLTKLSSMYIIAYIILNEFLAEYAFDLKYDYPFLYLILNLILLGAIVYLVVEFIKLLKTK